MDPAWTKAVGEPRDRWVPLAGPVAHLGRGILLGWATARAVVPPRRWVREAVAETRRQITDSFGLVIVVAMLGGALISQQVGVQFENNLPAWVIGAIVAASSITEVTPLFAAFVLIGVVGTRIAAEIGAMNVTEQVDALEVMQRDPIAYLVVPRVAGALIAGPLLMSFALAAAMISGWGSAVLVTRATSADFWFGVRHYMQDFPLFFALTKGVVFTGSIAMIGSYVGLEATGGSEGVGRATRRGVVLMVVGVILLDAALVPLLKWAGP